MNRIVFVISFIVFGNNLTGQSMLLSPFDYEVSTGSLKKLTVTDQKRFFFQGASSVNTTEQIDESLQGSQKLNFTLRMIHQEEGKKAKNGFDISVGINILNIKPTGIAVDSFDLKSLMFPETGNFGLMFTPALHWYLKREGNVLHRFSSEISASLRQNKVKNVFLEDSTGNIYSGPETVDFTIININFMFIRYNYYYQPDDDFRVDFNLGLYYNYFNVPNEDARSINKLFPYRNPLFDVSERSNLSSIGGKLSCGINGFLIFADVRYNLKTKAFTDENPFKGTVFNIGIAQNISILKL